MAIRTYSGTVTAAGSAGSATGETVVGPCNGRVIGVFLDYTGLPAGTCDVIVSAVTPAKTILTRSNSVTDGWFYPRILMQGADAADLTAIYDAVPVDGYLKVAIAQGDAAGTVAFYILVEMQ